MGDVLPREKRLRHRFERSAMDCARAEFMEFQQVQFGSVTFMLLEAILREPRAKVTHHPVARYLGDHAGGCDAQTDAVAVNDGGLWKWKRNDGQSIDQDVIGRVDQRADRKAHRSMACAQDVDAIDLNGVDSADGPPDFWIRDQLQIDFIAQFRHKLFGIVQLTMAKFFRKNYSSGYNRTRQGATAGFVNPGNLSHAGGAQFFFVTKSASPVHPPADYTNFRG